jgi:hypothetical protein
METESIVNCIFEVRELISGLGKVMSMRCPFGCIRFLTAKPSKLVDIKR